MARDRVETEPRRTSSPSDEWSRYQRSLEQASASFGRSVPARNLEASVAAESRRLQQALIRRIASNPPAPEKSSSSQSSAGAAPRVSRSEAPTLFQLQSQLGTAAKTNPEAVSPRVLVSAGFAPKQNSLAKIYTVKKSGTRAEGMALAKSDRPARRDAASQSRPAKAAAAVRMGSASAPVASNKRPIPQNSAPRPAKAMSQGAVAMAAPSKDSVVRVSKSKLLSSGVAVFVGQGASRAPLHGALASVLGALSPRVHLLSPKAQIYILQLKIPPRLRLFYRGLQPSGLIEGMALSRLMSRLRFFMRGRAFSGRRDNSFLRRLLRRWLRRKQLHKLNKKRVRRVSSNIARSVGKTKTADLKQYY